MTASDGSPPFGYASWDDRYAGDDYLFGTEANQFLVACRDLLGGADLAGTRVLCVSDGAAETPNSGKIRALGPPVNPKKEWRGSTRAWN